MEIRSLHGENRSPCLESPIVMKTRIHLSILSECYDLESLLKNF